MRFLEHSHLEGLETIKSSSKIKDDYQDIIEIIKSITDEEIVIKYQEQDSGKSLGTALKKIIEEKLLKLNWEKNLSIFDDKEVNSRGNGWKSDFVLNPHFSMIISFDHSSMMTNNLMKLALACEENDINKNVKTKFGVLITATNDLKMNGGFDSVVGEYEKYQVQCKVLKKHLNIPMVIIGLKAPENFKIIHQKINGRNKGEIEFII